MNVTILLLVAATSMRPGGDMRDSSMGVRAVSAGTPAPTVTIDAQPYARTTTCTGSYILTGTSTSATSVAWASSPSGDSGACTGTDTWSCTVAVSPDATGEGVETITVTATGDSGTGADTEDIGFYVAGAHSCFLAQSVDGDYNSTLANNDPVATWQNLGSSALDVTQATGTAQPTFKTSIVGGNPVVRCDGGDNLAASTASDWTFLHNGTDVTIGAAAMKTSTGLAQNILSNKAANSDGAIGYRMLLVETGGGIARLQMGNGSGSVFVLSSAGGSFAVNTFNLTQHVVDDDGGAGADGFNTTNGTTVSAAKSAAYTASDGNPLQICALAGTGNLTGDLFRVLIYTSALTATQRGINQAVDEWALGGSFPVTP